jgi:tetratricopeptide (TPR) repeat protein
LVTASRIRITKVVDRIAALLNQIARLQPRFSWEHAEEAEPELVSDKVLARFADKNLFIAVCTAKERVVESGALSPPWLQPRKLAADAKAFGWKTSDWLIQEIGVAFGRGMKVILLLEKGIRRPGELQGNLEFVEFERTAPEKCAEKLMAMIAALSPPDKAAQAPSSQPAEATAPATTAEPQVPEWDWKHPRPDWTSKEFDQALFFAVFERAKDVQQEITSVYLATDEGAKEENRRMWAASVEFYSIIFGEGGDLAALKKNAETAPAIGEVWAYLARAYRKYDEHESAAAAYERAIESESNVVLRIGYVGEAAIECHATGNDTRAQQLLELMRELGGEQPDCESAVLKAEEAFAQKLSDHDVIIGSLERLLEVDPSNIDTRFKLAYKYGDLEMEDLAAYHYTKIPPHERNDNAWNNLGLAFGELALPVRAVSALRESEKKGSTLAMANLAARLSNAGFFNEASDILNRALDVEDHHRNVDTTLGNLKGVPEDEGKRQEEIFGRAGKISDFYRRIGRAMGLPRVKSLPRTWSSRFGELSLAESGDSITLSGSYDASGALSGSLMMGFTAPKVRYHIEFRCKVHGRGFLGEVFRNRVDEEAPPHHTSLLGGEINPTVLMWIDDQAQQISVMERGSTGEPNFYALQRV